jgi:membrane associated rhomboid family serine protease
MEISTGNVSTGADKCKGTASLLAANLISDAFFRKASTPGGYALSEYNSVTYVEIGIIAAPASGGAPGEDDFQVWKTNISNLADMLISITVKKTSVNFYIMFVIDPACRIAGGEEALREALSLGQKKLEAAGMIADMIDIDPENGTYRVVSGRKIGNRKVRSALEKTLSASGLSADEQLDRAQNTVNESRQKIRSLEASPESRTRGPSLLIFLIVANVLIFAAGSFMKLRTGTDPLVNFGIQDNAKIFAGEWWRLITSMFLHADIMHLVSNMLFLFMLGRTLNRYYTNLQLWLIYFFGGIAGNLLGLAFSDALSLGASGAIMGLGGALLYRMTLGKNAKEFRRTGNFSWLATSVIFNLAYGLFNPGIDNYGHFGGFFGGFIVALLIGITQNSRSSAAADTDT